MSFVKVILQYALAPNRPTIWDPAGEWEYLIDVLGEPKRMADTRKWPRITGAIWLLECPPGTEQRIGTAKILRINNRRIEFENEPASVRMAYRREIEDKIEIIGDRELWDLFFRREEFCL